MSSQAAYLGIDVGSVTTKFAVLDARDAVIATLYTRTRGDPIAALQNGLRELRAQMPRGVVIAGLGATGSARELAGVVVGADVVKNEITAHALGALRAVPDVQTIIEIGGQDSKIILLRDGLVADFAMNTICAAGTGAFLDQQATRLNLRIEDFGALALQSRTPAKIAGRCTVFAESDMIHQQQVGHRIEDILYGLCVALARNYLNNVALGKEVRAPVVFQGGVAANVGMVRAFEAELGGAVIVPPHYATIGAIGAAILAREWMARNGHMTAFRGFGLSERRYDTASFECAGCANNCEIVVLKLEGTVIARWGGRCERWTVNSG